MTVNPNRNVFIPNAFTPNGDNRNDVFFIHGGAGVKRVQKFVIADRWGEIIFDKSDIPVNNPSYGWNGDFLGKDMPPGAYVWFASILFVDGQEKVYTGDVNLIR